MIETSTIILMALSGAGAFLLAFSVLFNIIMILAGGVFYWYFKNSISERADLIDKAQIYENSKNVINNIEQIASSVVELKYILEEVAASHIAFNEPIYMKLIENIENVLENIYSFGEE